MMNKTEKALRVQLEMFLELSQRTPRAKQTLRPSFLAILFHRDIKYCMVNWNQEYICGISIHLANGL